MASGNGVQSMMQPLHRQNEQRSEQDRLYAERQEQTVRALENLVYARKAVIDGPVEQRTKLVG